MVKSALRRVLSGDPEGPGETVPGSEQSGAPGGEATGDPYLAGIGQREAGASNEEAKSVVTGVTVRDDGQVTTSTSSAEGKTPKKTDDEKRADFSRLASRRLSRALDALDSFANLSNSQSYMWDLDQESKIFTTLHERVEGIAKSFAEARAATAGKKPARPLSFTV